MATTFKGDFQPAAPPGTRGTPIFPDIDFDVTSEQALQRNQDAQAVHVVTGASRGIGLQFVKTLATQTKASAKHSQESTDELDKPNSQ